MLIERALFRILLPLSLCAFAMPANSADDVTCVALVLKVSPAKQAGFAQNVEEGCLPVWKQMIGTGLLAEARLFEVVRIDSSEQGVADWNFVLLYYIATSADVERFLKESRDRDCLEKVGYFELKREEVLKASPNSYHPLPYPSVRKVEPRVEYWIEYIAVRNTPAALNEYREAMRLTFGPVAEERMRSGTLYNFYGFETQRIVFSAPDMPMWNQVHVNGDLTGPDIPTFDCEAVFRKVNPESGGCRAAFDKLDAIRTKSRVDVTRLVLEMPNTSKDYDGQLSTSEKQQVSKGTQNPEAYELYLKGRSYWDKRTLTDLETAVSYFNQAIAKDPGYALAYSALADAYSVLPDYGGTPSDYPKSSAAARKALELDPALAHPHAVLGNAEIGHDWDFAGGEAEFKKALELDPNDATALMWHADNIGMFGGRENEALAEINRAHQLDPASSEISAVVGTVYIDARRYDEAIAACKKLANENPKFAPSHSCLASAYWGKHMYAEVIDEFKAYGQLSGYRNDSEYAAALEQGFRSGGWKGALSKSIEALQAQRETGHPYAYNIAQAYADLGDKEQAFQWLNKAYQERDDALMGLKTDFLLDPLRSDPRFGVLVRKVGLP